MEDNPLDVDTPNTIIYICQTYIIIIKNKTHTSQLCFSTYRLCTFYSTLQTRPGNTIYLKILKSKNSKTVKTN